VPVRINYHASYIEQHGIPTVRGPLKDIRLLCACGREHCNNKTRFFCPRCSKMKQKIVPYWTDNGKNTEDNCFLMHVLGRLP
jgi:hypothetical protein